ncbi:hypothetical protein I7I53_01615 [Histoplasma capsulatum var. duboisii H88]|uniref:Uncharacterized protein n=1 Tax=Ajellomyces capsulatus (strain H88) TaxID=544711 RepID=A0A8A1LQA4_AJEC8|nr:hypothetical protein I7I53_01615 [Histoplasma capsulatum var. duboisii H88]
MEQSEVLQNQIKGLYGRYGESKFLTMANVGHQPDIRKRLSLAPFLSSFKILQFYDIVIISFLFDVNTC